MLDGFKKKNNYFFIVHDCHHLVCSDLSSVLHLVCLDLSDIRHLVLMEERKVLNVMVFHNFHDLSDVQTLVVDYSDVHALFLVVDMNGGDGDGNVLVAVASYSNNNYDMDKNSNMYYFYIQAHPLSAKR